jgi:hypothetical protein
VVAVAGAVVIGVPAGIVIAWGWYALLEVVLFLVGAAVVIVVLSSGYGQQVVSAIALLLFVSILWNLWNGNCDALMVQWWPSFMQPLTRMCQTPPKFKPPVLYPDLAHPSMIPKQP